MEGYLNTQRFYILVEPEGSLATVVTSKNKYAKRYIRFINVRKILPR